MLDFKLRLLSC